MKRIFFNEVATRDGFQIEANFIPTDTKVALIDALSECGYAKIEVTSFTSPKAIPMLRDADEVMGRIRRVPGVEYTVLVPNLRERGDGAIVNMASVASSLKGVPNRFVYSLTKAAVIGLTKSVAADYVTHGIRCNAICPGTVESPSLDDRLRATGDYDAAMKAFVSRQPMGRLGRPEEIADLAVYLASAPYTTGQAHIIDGGWLN